MRWSVCVLLLVSASAVAGSLRFYGGNSANDADRVKIAVDDPADSRPGAPVDVGAQDFTIEMWIKPDARNKQSAIDCRDYEFIWGNIVLDRDRYEQGRSFGISLADGRVAFSVQTANFASSTVCGTTDLRDQKWHHVAVQRRYSDGKLWIFVDGREEASGYGPGGDVSYPDGGECGVPEICRNSDHFLVIGAEKHDLAAGFSGWIGEVRFSDALRYYGSNNPIGPFEADEHTVAWYRFDEGQGHVVGDSAPGGASSGVRSFGQGGGNSPGPEWSDDSPFSTN